METANIKEGIKLYRMLEAKAWELSKRYIAQAHEDGYINLTEWRRTGHLYPETELTESGIELKLFDDSDYEGSIFMPLEWLLAEDPTALHAEMKEHYLKWAAEWKAKREAEDLADAQKREKKEREKLEELKKKYETQ
jgi:hypothetical protein